MICELILGALVIFGIVMTNKPYVFNPYFWRDTLWPNINFYREQKQTIESVQHNDETYVTAANMVGKDFIAGYIVLSHFLSALKLGFDCRIVTTSVKDDHLSVLWGEIGRYVMTAKTPLRQEDGGPLIVNHHEIRRASEGKNGYSYLLGQVSKKGEGMAGHHAAWTLGVIDEASGVDDEVYSQMIRWARRLFIFGNPNSCANFFYRGVKSGDLLAAV